MRLTFQFSHKNRTPFNQSTFGGYSGILAVELIASSVYALVTMTITSLFFSMGMYLGALSSHFEFILKQLSDRAGEGYTGRGRRLALKEYLISAIQLHNLAKE